MHWLIERNVANEDSYDNFVATVDRLGIPYSIITVVPFSHEIIDFPEDSEGPYFVYGSVTLCNKIAPKMGWKVFTNENFDYEVWSEKWKGDLLNEEAVTGPFQSVPINHERFFIRPCKDNKAFTGLVTTIQDYHDWVDKVRIVKHSDYGSSEDVNFDLDEMVMVSPVQNIAQEIRFYIVRNRVVTHSTYRLGNRTTYLDESYTNQDAIWFVQGIIHTWQPDDAFVLDVALVDGEYKVIEVNCINCAGMYASDVNKLVDAFNTQLLYGGLGYGRI